MKKITLLSLMIGLSSLMFGQMNYTTINGPQNTGQNPEGLVTFNEDVGTTTGWTVIMNNSTSHPGWTANQSMPFSFEFNGTAVTDYKVSSTGILTFDVGTSVNPTSANVALPSANVPDQSVCVWGLEKTAGSSNDQIWSATLGTAPNRQHWIHFASFNKPGGGTLFTYWSIVLDEGTNDIFVVDHRTANGSVALTVGLQLDATTAVSACGSPNIGSVATSTSAADNKFYHFKPSSTGQATYDLAVMSETLGEYYAKVGQNLNITGVVANWGSATVTDFDLNYSVNGGATVTQSVTGQNLGTCGGQYSFNHATPWNPSATEFVNIEIWCTNINGTNADEYTANDKVSRDLIAYDQSDDRVSLYEVYTSSTCPPCKPGNEALHAVVDSEPQTEFALVKYQVNWPGNGDPYYTQEIRDRVNYYGVNSAPTLNINGGQSDYAGHSMNPGSFSSSIYNGEKNTPAVVSVAATYERWGQSIKAYVDVSAPHMSITEPFDVYIAVIEERTENNAETNGENEFIHVVKKMLPDGDGTPFTSLTMGSSVNVTEEHGFVDDYRLPNTSVDEINHNTEHSVENFENLKVVAWVQNPGNKHVYQASNATEINVGLVEVSETGSIMGIYPNPANTTSTFDYIVKQASDVTINIIGMDGKIVKNVLSTHQTVGAYKETVDVSSLPVGNYLVEFKIGENVVSQKLNVVR